MASTVIHIHVLDSLMHTHTHTHTHTHSHAHPQAQVHAYTHINVSIHNKLNLFLRKNTFYVTSNFF